MDAELERKVAQLEISVKDMDNRLTILHREQAALLMETKSLKGTEKKDHSTEIKDIQSSIETVKTNLDSKMDAFRKHANSVLDEIYDSVDEIKQVKVEQSKPDLKPMEDRINELNTKMSAVAKAIEILNKAINSQKDVEKLRIEIESMKTKNVPTLVKDLSLETQKLHNKFFVLEDSIKSMQKKLEADN